MERVITVACECAAQPCVHTAANISAAVLAFSIVSLMLACFAAVMAHRASRSVIRNSQ